MENVYANDKPFFPKEEETYVPIKTDQYAKLILSMQKLEDIRNIAKQSIMEDEDKVHAIRAILGA